MLLKTFPRWLCKELRREAVYRSVPLATLRFCCVRFAGQEPSPLSPGFAHLRLGGGSDRIGYQRFDFEVGNAFDRNAGSWHASGECMVFPSMSGVGAVNAWAFRGRCNLEEPHQL